MSGKTFILFALTLVATLIIGLAIADPDVTPDDLVGILLSRFAWLGSGVSTALWLIAMRRIWRVEGSLHHLVARMLSILTLVALNVTIVLLFWPDTFFGGSPVHFSYEQIRVVVAFLAGMSIMAAIWQLTAPPQARVPRTDGRRYP